MKLIVYLALLLLGPAAVASVCSPPDGTKALVRAQFTQNDHREVVCGSNHDCAGLYVTEEGFLHPCKPWIKPGQPWDTPQPEEWGKDDCPDKVGYETWSLGGLTCSSRPPGTVAVEFVMLRAAKHGETRYVFDLWGSAQGQYHARCDDGTFKPEPQFTRCALVTAAPSPVVTPKLRKPLAGDAKVGPIPRLR